LAALVIFSSSLERRAAWESAALNIFAMRALRLGDLSRAM